MKNRIKIGPKTDIGYCELLQQCLLKQSEKRANLILITQTANFADALMTKVNALPLEKLVTHVVVETILNLNALRLKEGQAGPVIKKKVR